MSGRDTLTPQQARFVEEYLVDLNAGRAYERAGYRARGKSADVNASRLLANARVAAAVAAAQANRATRTEITQDYVLRNLTEVVERCMQRAPVMVRAGREWVQATDDEGRDVWQFDARGANQALGLLARHLGMLTDRVEHTGKDGGPIPVQVWRFGDREVAF